MSPLAPLLLLLLAAAPALAGPGGRRLQLERAAAAGAAALAADAAPAAPRTASTPGSVDVTLEQVEAENWAVEAPTAGKAAQGPSIHQRFRWAVGYIEATQRMGIYPQWQCPPEWKLGARFAGQTGDLMGTKCEPWLARPAVTLLHELLLPGTAKGLEWGSGSGTLWLLAGHVKHLTTIEHNPAWLVLTQGAAEDAFSAQFLQERWTLRYRPTHPRDAGGYVEGPQEEDASEYVAAGLTAAEQQASFDLVVVDGRGRPACVARAMRLLKPSGGVLVVDNAERPLVGEALAGVPGHWLRFDAATSASTTAVFVTCTPGAC